LEKSVLQIILAGSRSSTCDECGAEVPTEELFAFNGIGVPRKLTAKSVPKMNAPGYKIAPFTPAYDWICSTIELFYGGGEAPASLDAGRYSFSNSLYAIYRNSHGFNYGLSAGQILQSIAEDVGWNAAPAIIDGVEVKTCTFDNHVNFGQRELTIQGEAVRVACVEPWSKVLSPEGQLRVGSSDYNFYLAWLGRPGLTKAVYDHNREIWLG
jgi:hypothetical protein